MASVAGSGCAGATQLRHWEYAFSKEELRKPLSARAGRSPRERCRLLQRSKLSSRPVKPRGRGGVAVQQLAELAEGCWGSATRNSSAEDEGSLAKQEAVLQVAESWPPVGEEKEELPSFQHRPGVNGLLLGFESKDAFYGQRSGAEVEQELARLAMLLQNLLREFAILKDSVGHLEDETGSVQEVGNRLERNCLNQLEEVNQDISLKMNSMASKVDEATAAVAKTDKFINSKFQALLQRTDARCESVESMWEDFRNGVHERFESNELSREDWSRRLQQQLQSTHQFAEDLSGRLDARHAQSKTWVEELRSETFNHKYQLSWLNQEMDCQKQLMVARVAEVEKAAADSTAKQVAAAIEREDQLRARQASAEEAAQHMFKDLKVQLQEQRDSETEERLKLSQSLVELEKRVASQIDEQGNCEERLRSRHDSAVEAVQQMFKDLKAQMQEQRDSETEERLKLSQSLVELEKRVAGHEETHTKVQALLEDSDTGIRAAEERTLEHCNQVLDDLHYELTASMEDEGKRLQEECLQQLDKVNEDIELKMTSMASKVDEATATVADAKAFVASELEVLQRRTDGRCESVESMWEDFRRGILERLDSNELTTEDLSQRLQISEELSERLDAHHAQSKKWAEELRSEASKEKQKLSWLIQEMGRQKLETKAPGVAEAARREVRPHLSPALELPAAAAPQEAAVASKPPLEPLERKADLAPEEAVIPTPSPSSPAPAEASRPQTVSAEHADRAAEEAQESPAAEPPAAAVSQEAAVASKPPLEPLERKADLAPEEAVIPTPSPSSPAPAEASRPQNVSAEHADRAAEEAAVASKPPPERVLAEDVHPSNEAQVTHGASGSSGQPGNEASSGSQPSASAGGRPAAAALTESSISSESRSGDAPGLYGPGAQARARGGSASSADAASKPLETEGSSSISSSWEGTGPGKPESGRVMATRMLADALKSFSGDLRQAARSISSRLSSPTSSHRPSLAPSPATSPREELRASSRHRTAPAALAKEAPPSVEPAAPRDMEATGKKATEQVTAPAAGAQGTASSAPSPARPRSAAEVVASRKSSAEPIAEDAVQKAALGSAPPLSRPSSEEGRRPDSTSRAHADAAPKKVASRKPSAAEPIAEDAVQKAAMGSAPPLSRPSREEGRRPDSTLADGADAAPKQVSEPASQPSEVPASSQTSSPPDVSGLPMEDALKVLLSSVNRASQELALLTQDEPGKKVTRAASGSFAQGRGNEASSRSQPSASAGGTPAAAALTESSISSLSRSGDPASSADAASIPLETEGHAEGPVDAEPLETGEAASSADAGSLPETDRVGNLPDPSVGLAGVNWSTVDLNTGLEDSGMLKQISFMSNEEKSGLSLSSHSPGSQAAGVAETYQEGSESSAVNSEEDLPVFGSLPAARPPAEEPLPSFGPRSSRPWSPGRAYSGSRMQLDEDSDGSLAPDSDGFLDLDLI